MARGAAQQTPRKRAKQPRKQAVPAYEQTMFFPRLRRQAKWVFFLLALVFAVGFVAFGVGSGSSGLSDVLQGNFFGGGGSSTSSQIDDKEKQLQRRPKDVALYLDIAGLYQQDQQNGKALATLRRGLKVAPSNYDLLNRVATIKSAEAHQLVNDYATARAVLSEKVVPPPYASGSPLTDQAIQDTYTQALQTKVSEAQSKALTALQGVESDYKRAAQAARGTSNEASAQLQLAAVAIDALNLSSQPSDVQAAIDAYERYLKIAPEGSATADVQQRLAQLQAFLGQSGG
jgi:tetratricopeptide (TPR) repeat protein